MQKLLGLTIANAILFCFFAVNQMGRKIIITGASGFLSWHLLQAIEPDAEIFCISRTKPNSNRPSTFLPCDITDYITLGNYFEDIEPDAVIHSAAISDANLCQQEKEKSYAVNVEATKNLAGLCCDYNIPFVFTSTDLVFDGKKGNYTEEDSPNPVNAYGEQKAIAEQEVARIYSPATIARLPLMFGYAEAGSSNYLQKFVQGLKQDQTVKLFTDEYRSVCGATSVSKGIIQLLGYAGIIHIAGPEKLSRYQFGLLAAEAYGLNKTLLQPCLQVDVQMAAPRPPDVSLNISKAVSLGYNTLPVAEELQLIAAGTGF